MPSDQEEASHTIVAGEGIHRVEEKSFPWTGETHHGKSSVDEEGSVHPAIMSVVECGVGMSPGQEDTVLKVKWQTQDFWIQQKQAHLDS